jgi:hypothetical protein
VTRPHSSGVEQVVGLPAPLLHPLAEPGEVSTLPSELLAQLLQLPLSQILG